jgi:hypothetical protein
MMSKEKRTQPCPNCDGLMEGCGNGWYCRNPDCGYNYVIVPKQKVWVVSLHTFDWCFLRHVCKTKETAIKYWGEIRKECIENNDRMIKYCNEQGYTDAEDWEYCNDILRNLKPGEEPPADDTRCDEYPYMKEWVVD